MDELLPPPSISLSWSPSSIRPKAAILLRELRLVENPEKGLEIRRIPFREGLNIVWADPKVASARRGGSRLAGHSAGKSTLCRIIRWLLGEARFGNEELQGAVGTDFPKGLAVLHLELDGKPWVVGRGFWNTKEHWAVESDSIDSVLAGGVPLKGDIAGFEAELQRVTVGSLVRRQLPGVDVPLAPTDVLAWLTRDQNCALQTVDAWRESTSPHEKSINSKGGRHVLMRLVLGLVDDPELDEMGTCAQLEARKSDETAKKPELVANAYATCEPLRFVLGKTGNTLKGVLLLSKSEQLVQSKTDRLRVLKNQRDAIDVTKAEADHEAAFSALTSKRQEISGLKREVRDIDKRLSERGAEAIEAARLEAEQSRQIPPGYCARKKHEVEGLCDHFMESPAPITTHQLKTAIEGQVELLEIQKREAEESLYHSEQGLPFLAEREATTRSALERARRDFIEKEQQIASLAAEINAANAVINLAKEAFDAQDANKSEIKELTKAIRVSTGRQQEIRKRSFDRIEFGQLYQEVLRFLLGPEASGSLAFDASGHLDLTVKTRTKLSSTAIDALKVIAFDIAAMFWSAAGRGHHPRFLIHDSPRVADMSPVPYAAIFEVGHEAEGLAQSLPNFQYLVTTTEPPPADLNAHVICELDASTPDGRLFGRDF
jgi:hypothetical protein